MQSAAYPGFVGLTLLWRSAIVTGHAVGDGTTDAAP
jgi:hypothetical protein